MAIKHVSSAPTKAQLQLTNGQWLRKFAPASPTFWAKVDEISALSSLALAIF